MMMRVLTALTLAAGLALLVVGADLLVRGAGGLGRTLGLSPVVIGLTIVAAATSAPELAVSLDAALTGSPGLAVGNAVGSNTVNVLLVLGAVAVTGSQRVDKQLLRLDVPTALAAAVVLLVLSLDGSLGRADGALLVLGLVGYLLLAVGRQRRSSVHRGDDGEGSGDGDGGDGDGSVDGGSGDGSAAAAPRHLPLVAAGVLLLALGARWMVRAASEVAVAVGVSELVIGLTVVSVATALPEIVTSVVAVLKGHREMAVGNVIGSNIFNVGAVLGVTAVAAPLAVPAAAVRLDIPVMIAATVALAAMLFTGSRISRAEGAVLLAWFAAYTGYLVLEAEAHDALGAYSAVLLYLCLPVTVVALLGFSTREVRARR